MKKADAIRILARHGDTLRRMGVRHLALFGSVVRDEATGASDVDVLVEWEDTAGYFQFLDVQEFLQRELEVTRVDLVSRDALFEDLRDGILREAVHVL